MGVDSLRLRPALTPITRSGEAHAEETSFVGALISLVITVYNWCWWSQARRVHDRREGRAAARLRARAQRRAARRAEGHAAAQGARSQRRSISLLICLGLTFFIFHNLSQI